MQIEASDGGKAAAGSSDAAFEGLEAELCSESAVFLADTHDKSGEGKSLSISLLSSPIRLFGIPPQGVLLRAAFHAQHSFSNCHICHIGINQVVKRGGPLSLIGSLLLDRALDNGIRGAGGQVLISEASEDSSCCGNASVDQPQSVRIVRSSRAEATSAPLAQFEPFKGPFPTLQAIDENPSEASMLADRLGWLAILDLL